MEIRDVNGRLYLSSLEYRDADALAENANDAEVARYAARPGEFPHPYHAENAVAMIVHAKRMLGAGREFHFGIRLNDGRLVGACRVSAEEESGSIGFWLGRAHWGNGYAREALELLVEFCFRDLGMHTVSARVLQSNARSMHTLSSLGFSIEGEANADLESGEIVFTKQRGNRALERNVAGKRPHVGIYSLT